MIRIFRRLDPRILADLRRQKKAIYKGMACVGVAAVLTGVTIPLTERALDAIGRAVPIAVSLGEKLPGETAISKEFGITITEARERLGRMQAKPSESRTQVQARQLRAIQDLGWICLLVVLLFGLKYSFTRGQTYYLSMASARLSADLRQRLYTKLQRLPIQYFSDRRMGGIQSVLTNDVNVYQNAVSMIRDSIDGPVKAIVAVVSIFIIQWQLALVAMVFVPLLAWLVYQNGRRIKSAQRNVQDDLAELNSMAQESLYGSRVIKAFAAEDRMKVVFGRIVAKSLESQDSSVRQFAKLRPMVELLGAVSLAAILYICGWMAMGGTLMLTQIVALTLALDVINQGAKAMANLSATYNQVQAAADRIHSEVLDVEEEPIDLPGQREIEKPEGRIEFRGVSFSYPDGTPALKNVSFVIEPGTSLALVGPSGAGKSTIADLLLRFYDPSDGQIFYDGVDIRELKGAWYRRQIGVVPQQTFLFAGPISENLRLGAPDATDEEIVAAAVAANADGFIRSTPNGYETELGERGVRMSGGEGQRLAIARAIARDPKVLLLDEATSNLDAHSEQVVTEALEHAMQRRTTLFIAHRLTTAARATKIVMLKRGEVLEQGSHDELLAANQAYAAMYRAFTSGVMAGEM